MLKQDELIEALHDGQKAAERCGRFCVVGASVEETGYWLHHNGTGSSDTDHQLVYAQPALNLDKGKLTERLRAWITDLHSGNKIDLNATMEVNVVRGPALPGWPWTLRYDPNTGVTVATITYSSGGTA